MPQVVKFLDCSPSKISVHFILYRKTKSRQSEKIWMVGNPTHQVSINYITSISNLLDQDSSCKYKRCLPVNLY